MYLVFKDTWPSLVSCTPLTISTPVSYTHLDVYKRQLLSCFGSTHGSHYLFILAAFSVELLRVSTSFSLFNYITEYSNILAIFITNFNQLKTSNGCFTATSMLLPYSSLVLQKLLQIHLFPPSPIINFVMSLRTLEDRLAQYSIISFIRTLLDRIPL